MNPFIIIVSDNVVESVHSTTKENATQDFLSYVSARISNFDEYSQTDIDNAINEGYVKFGNGSVCLTWV
jgi:hypothetical protein